MLRDECMEKVKFEAMFRQLPDAIFLSTVPEGRIVEANPAAERITGLSRDQLIGKTSTELGFWVNASERARYLEELGKNRKIADFEALFRNARSEHVRGLLWGEWLDLPEGPHVLTILRDVTSLRREQEELQQRLRDQRHLLQFAADLTQNMDRTAVHALIARHAAVFSGAFLVSLSEWCETLQELVLRHLEIENSWLQKIASILGKKPEAIRVRLSPEQYREVMEKRWISVDSLHEVTFGAIPRPVCALMERALGLTHFIGIAFVVEERLYGTAMLGFRKKGELPLQETLETFHNVAALALRRARLEEEGARMQERLAQAQKMESVGRLAGGVAHDFNNMLGVIVGHAEMALSREAELDGQTREDLREILHAAQRSAELTTQLLAFSRQQAASPRALDVDAAITGMLRMMRRTIGEHVRLEWKPGAHGAAVWIDPVQMDQIILNLVVNARDAISDGGVITLETACRRLKEADVDAQDENARLLAGRDVVVISLSDTGCGMGPDQLARLFEPFFTTKGPGRGTGMGLPTVHGIVKQNQGFIRVHSQKGEGSTFLVYLPRTDASPQMEEKKPAATAVGSETVLLVEDEESILRVGKTILERHGYTVFGFSNPRQALSFLETQALRVHLLVTDVIMPELNGRELWEKAHVLHPGLRVLFISGYPADVVTSQGILEPGTCYLQKPFAIESLLSAVRAALDGEP